MYDLIDEKLKNYYIIAHKYVFIICLSLSLTFGILSVFYNVALVFLVIFAIITLIFFITWNINKKMYGKKLLYANGVITIYDHKNLKINDFKLDALKKKNIKIAFNYYPKFCYKNCLVLYSNIEPYENMEYRSYWNDPNIVIIQNTELIDNINKQ